MKELTLATQYERLKRKKPVKQGKLDMQIGSKDWFEFSTELKRRYKNATWIPLRACLTNSNEVRLNQVGLIEDGIYVGTAAFPPDRMAEAEHCGWHEIGIGTTPSPFAYEDGQYKRADEFQYNEKQTIGSNLVFERRISAIGKRNWIIDPDLTLALKLFPDGDNWIAPDENFTIAVRTKQDHDGNSTLVEIRKDFLLDYLAARNLNLRMSIYRQRVMTVNALSETPYDSVGTLDEQRDGARFSLLIRTLDQIYGGEAAVFHVWHEDFDHRQDSPKLDASSGKRTGGASKTVKGRAYSGFRIEGEFWRDEWIEHNGYSPRVRFDEPNVYPQFVVENDGTKMASNNLAHEDIGRWLWFRTQVIQSLLSNKGFFLKWYTDDTAGVFSPSGQNVHFGLNEHNLIVAYAYEVARLPVWQQEIWAAYSVEPEGGLGDELAASHVRAAPAHTKAPEEKLLGCIELLNASFAKKFGSELYAHTEEVQNKARPISRYSVFSDADLLRLAKELHRTVIEPIRIGVLRSALNQPDSKLGSLKLIEQILTDLVGQDPAHNLMGVLHGVYQLRIADSHLTSAAIEPAFQLAQIDRGVHHVRQAKQLIDNFARSLWEIAGSIDSR